MARLLLSCLLLFVSAHTVSSAGSKPTGVQLMFVTLELRSPGYRGHREFWRHALLRTAYQALFLAVYFISA